MKPINNYIYENKEILGGNNPFKIKDVVYLKFPIQYSIKLTLKQFSLYIEHINIINNEYELSIGNKIQNYNIPITKELLNISSSYFPFDVEKHFNKKISEVDLLLNDSELGIKIIKLIPQGILRNLPIENLIDVKSYLRLRDILSKIDPTFSLWQNAIDKKNNTLNKGELLIKDLLNKKSGIPNLTFILNFNIDYTLKLKPIYFKGKNKEISRFDVEKIDSIINIDNDSIVSLNIYDIKKELKNNEEKNIKFNLTELIDNKKVKIANSLVGIISQTNHSLNKFINHFKINKFNIKDEFKNKYLNIINNEINS